MNQISLAEYRQQIESAIESGRYEQAVAHSKHILEQYPKYVKAYWLLGKVMLEAGHDDHAMDMFQRVLSANPEHMLAWVGMSEVAQKRGDLEDAVWYLQRAFELATDNEMVAQELRRLYGELEGHEPERLQLTEGALAKLYLRGDLLTRAITELRKLVEAYPDRLDLKVALAEALWRNGQRLEASEVCQEILNVQPYNLKANLILGEIWESSGREAEAQPYLERASALDPEYEMADALFGSASPIPADVAKITPLAYDAEVAEERPGWMETLEERRPIEAEEPMTAEIEIPGWLQELATESALAAGAQPHQTQEPVPSGELEAEVEADEEQVPGAPDDTQKADKPSESESTEAEAPMEEGPEEIALEEMPEEDGLEWLGELRDEEVAASEGEGPREDEYEEEEIPAWLVELRAGTDETAETEARAAAEDDEEIEPEPAEIPDWLQDLAPVAAEPERTLDEAVFGEEVPVEPLETDSPVAEEAAPDTPAVEEAAPDQTEDDDEKALESETREAAPEESQAEPVAPEEPVALEEIEEIEALGQGEELPSWLESEELPSGDEALAWLAQLAEGKEEELRAQAEMEGVARADALMEDDEPEMTGLRPSQETESEEDVEASAPVTAEQEAEEEADEEAIEEPEEAFGWTAFAERGADGEAEGEPLSEEAEPTAAMRYSSVSTGELIGILSGRRVSVPEDEVSGEAEEAEPALEPESEIEAGAEEGADEEAMPEETAEEAPEAVAKEPEDEVEAAEPSKQEVEIEEVAEQAPEAAAEEPEEEPLEAREAVTPGVPDMPTREEEPEQPPTTEEPPVETPTPPAPELEGEEEVDMEAPFVEEEGELEEKTTPVPAPEPTGFVPGPLVEEVAAEEEEPPLEEAPVSLDEPEPAETEATAEPEGEKEESAALEGEPEPERPGELETVTEDVSPAEAAEETEIEDLERFVAAQRSYAREHPENREAQLELGRILWQADKREDAAVAYEQLLDEDDLLGDVIGDLENYTEQEADPRLMQALGDAYVRADRLPEALDTYRRALASL